MNDEQLAADAAITPFRRNLLRAGYLLLVVGLGLNYWWGFFTNGLQYELMEGVVVALLTALSLLSIIGLFYPVKMIPLLLFEVLWKLLWMSVVVPQAYLTGAVDSAMGEVIFACSIGVVYLYIVPWKYVIKTYFRSPAEPWRKQGS